MSAKIVKLKFQTSIKTRRKLHNFLTLCVLLGSSEKRPIQLLIITLIC